MKQLDQKLRDLVVANLDVAEITAHRFAGLGRSRGVEEDDLRQEAYYGLCVAALKYDAKKGARFRTVAFQWCRKAVERASLQASASLPALPFRERATDTSCSSDLASATSDNAADFYSSGSTNSSGSSACSSDFLDCSPSEAMQREEVYLKVDKLLNLLSLQEKRIVCRVYGINCEPIGFKEIAKELGLGRMRVQEIYNKALTKMELTPPSLPEGEDVLAA